MKRFLITCAARTGSTMLRHMLNSHPEILCHGEVFGQARVLRIFRKKVIHAIEGPEGEKYIENLDYKRKLDKLFCSDPEKFVDKIIYASDQSAHRAIGFKFKTDEYFNPRFKKIAHHLRDSIDIHVIHLRRKDLLAQYISHQRVLKRQTKTVYFEDNQHIDNKNIKIKISHFSKYLKDVTKREAEIEKEFEGHAMMSIWYENLIGTGSKELMSILDFLHLGYHPLNSPTKKISRDLSSLIKNYDQATDFLKNSIYQDRRAGSKFL